MSNDKFTADARHTILESIRNGNREGVAASAAFINRATLQRWKSRGRKGEEPYAAFFDELEFAKDEAEETMMARQRGDNDEGALDRDSARFWLVRSRSREYGDQAKLIVSVDQSHSQFLDYLESQLDETTYARVLQGWIAHRSLGPASSTALEQVTGSAGDGVRPALDAVDTEGHETLSRAAPPGTRR